MGKVGSMSIIEQALIALATINSLALIVNFLFNIKNIANNDAMLELTKQIHEFNKRCREADNEESKPFRELNRQSMLANLHYLNKLNETADMQRNEVTRRDRFNI